MLAAARDETDLDALLRDWSLTKSDLNEIQRARGLGRLWTALHLCSLRRTGRFADDPERIPHEAIVHLAQQIDIHPPARLSVLPRQASDSAIRARVREHLGFVPFSADAEARLKDTLAELALDGLGPAELVERAEAFLLTARVILPARAALERLVASQNRQALEALFARIAARFSASTCTAFDRLLSNARDEDTESDSRATIGRFRTPSASSMGRFTRTAGERLEEINALLRDLPDLGDLSHRVVRQLAGLCQRYDGHALRRFPTAKRYSLLACFLLERRQGLLDDMVQAHDNHMTGLMRRARHAAEADARQLRQAAEAGLVTLIDTGEAVLTGDREESVVGLRERIGADRLAGALMACRAVAANDARGVVDAVIARYPDLRKSLPAFWSLPFTSDTGRGDLLVALDLVRRLDQGAIKALPDDAPTDFVPAGWQKALRDDHGQLRRSLWETALAVAVRDALRAGDLYLPHSRQHAGFWSLVLNERLWASSRTACYADLGLSEQPGEHLAQLAGEIGNVATAFTDRLPTNNFARIDQGQLSLRRPDALAVTAELRSLRRLIESRMPRIRLEDVLLDVDRRCGFTRTFRPLAGYEPRDTDTYRTLLATLIAHGTNLGLTAMGSSVEGLAAADLQHVSRWLVRDATLKAANVQIIEHQHRLPFAAVWGDGRLSSSDGQRFAAPPGTLIGAYQPRHFGYYDRAVSVYSHLSDRLGVYGTLVISCAPREATYVLTSILDNDTSIAPEMHTTDTHGFTEALWGLCHLLGIDFIGRRHVGRAPQERGEAPYIANVVALRLAREPAHVHIVDQTLAQWADRAVDSWSGHREFLSS